MSVTIILSIILIICFYLLKDFNLIEYARNTYYMIKLPGPHAIPIIGWTFKIAKLKIEDILYFLEGYMEKFQHVGKTWIVGIPIVILCDIVDCEAFLGSMRYITKGIHYESVKGWLNEGLLTSTGEKWHKRRKLLTPAFHFKILEDSLPSICKNARTLAEKLKAQNGNVIRIDKFVNLCTLDVICESAMGVKLDAQNDKSSQYVSDITEISHIIMERNVYFWLNRDFTFFLTPTGYRYKRTLNRLHDFTQKVITDRKELYKKEKLLGENADSKKRKAFLDFLIDLENNNPGTFTQEDMREEVDTFMFEHAVNTIKKEKIINILTASKQHVKKIREDPTRSVREKNFVGHDTTSAAIVHALLLLGNHPECQEKALLELDEIFQGSDRDVTYNDLHKMKYLEQVIKETLRILPSVPIFTRKLEKDFITSKGYLVPRMTNVVFFPHYYHFKQPYFKDYKKFDPERFSEENKDRPAYVYIPFSAGPRNCIGQKFAMMEMKVVLSTVIRNLKFKSMKNYKDFKYSPLLIIRACEPIMMEFNPRN